MTTNIVLVGQNYFLGPSGPELKSGGTPVVAGQFGAGIVPIAAVQTATGYEVAWEQTGTNQFWVWATDSNGNDTPPHVFNNMPGNSFAVEAIETAFGQDLNGDTVIGPPGMTVIETDGVTWLTQVGNNYFLYNSSGAGPELEYQGAPVVAGQFGIGIVPIAAEQTATGYEVAWRQSGGIGFWVWNTDGNGNDLPPHPLNNVPANAIALESLEPSFKQDLNGDGVIGVAHVTQVGNFYFLYNTTGGAEPALSSGGVPVVAGQFGAGLVPIDAVQTAAGYLVVWEQAGANQFWVWKTDSNGNDMPPHVFNNMPGNSFAVEAIETAFNHDLNGDGTIGPPGMSVIETNGSTWLTQVGNEYFLDNTSGVGPSLKFGGTPVLAGQFGAGLAPIAAEQTASGYEVAWKQAGADAFWVWNTDSNGNDLPPHPFNNVSGSTPGFEALELSFQQDLNGDGVIGVPAGSHTLVAATQGLVASAGASTTPTVFASSGGGSLVGFADASPTSAPNTTTDSLLFTEPGFGSSVVDLVSSEAASPVSLIYDPPNSPAIGAGGSGPIDLLNATTANGSAGILART